MATAAAKTKLTDGLTTIERLTEVYATRRETLVSKMSQLEAETRAIQKKRIAGIRIAIAGVRDAKAELEAALKDRKGDFEKPKTRTFHGIKVGFRKLVGTLGWSDAAQVVKLIKKHFPDQVDTLVKTTETPVKDALANLAVADLKRLGVSVADDTDEVVISAGKGDIEKVVEALLKDTPEEP